MSSSSVNTALLTSLASTPPELSLDPSDLAAALASPPFVSLPGALNLRDLGAIAPLHLARGRVLRSGTLDIMPATSRAQLGVNVVFDLRRLDEVKPAAAGTAMEDGLPRVVACPYMGGARMPNEPVLADFASRSDGGVGVGYRKMYTDILEGYRTGYRKVFESVRDGEKVLFHCTAGKDRTGVLAALILDLMGVPRDLISLDYALTRVGTEPFKAKLQPLALQSVAKIAAANGGGDEDHMVNLASIAALPGVVEFLSSDGAVMADFLEYLQQKWGGAEGYLKTDLEFSEGDIQKIRARLEPKF